MIRSRMHVCRRFLQPIHSFPESEKNVLSHEVDRMRRHEPHQNSSCTSQVGLFFVIWQGIVSFLRILFCSTVWRSKSVVPNGLVKEIIRFWGCEDTNFLRGSSLDRMPLWTPVPGSQSSPPREGRRREASTPSLTTLSRSLLRYTGKWML